jgi:YhcG PDDEXK nuclease domain
VDFIRGTPGRERDLELALLTDIERFMTALGKGFSFYGRQLALTVGDRDFATDLVFYHHPQRRFVVIELKIGEFDPEHAGKLNFYVSTIDDQLAGAAVLDARAFAGRSGSLPSGRRGDRNSSGAGACSTRRASRSSAGGSCPRFRDRPQR